MSLKRNKQGTDEIYFSRKFADNKKPKIQTSSFRVKLHSLQRPPIVGNSARNILVGERSNLNRDDVKMNITS
jgi:hypothetical protein